MLNILLDLTVLLIKLPKHAHISAEYESSLISHFTTTMRNMGLYDVVNISHILYLV